LNGCVSRSWPGDRHEIRRALRWRSALEEIKEDHGREKAQNSQKEA
jgi:hypothetical protein